MIFETEHDRQEHLDLIRFNFESCGHFDPMFFTEFEGKHICTPLEFKTAEDKEDASRMMVQLIAKGMIRELCFAAESWMAQVKPSDDPCPVRNRTDKQECIIASFANAKEENVYCAIIQRDKKGKPTLQPFQKWDDRIGTSGRFMNLFQSAAAMTN